MFDVSTAPARERADEGFVHGADHGAVPAPGIAPGIALDLSHGVDVRLIGDVELAVVSMRGPASGADRVGQLRRVVRDVASGRIGPCKFLVFDLCGAPAEAARPAGRPAPGFEALVEDVSNLIFQAPVLSIAWARGHLSGPDLELALACSMLVGEEGARFGFDLDLVDSLRTYALLAHKLGFVRAERLMENGSVVGAAEAHDLMLVHSVVPARDGTDEIRSFARSRLRRHNSACGLYRAQRIAMAATSGGPAMAGGGAAAAGLSGAH